MASEAKHTPLPWFLQTSVRLASIHGADGKCVASTGSGYSRGEKECNANAELIVTAVNERATLLAERDAALVAVEEAKEERDRLRLLLSRAHYELDIAEQHFRAPAKPMDGLFGSRVNVLREDIRRELVGCPDPAVSSLPTAQVKG